MEDRGEDRKAAYDKYSLGSTINKFINASVMIELKRRRQAR